MRSAIAMESLSSLKQLFVTVFLSVVAGVIVMPAMTDVTISALCPAGQFQCSLAIYLSGIQQALIGVGSVAITPLIGNLSDRYGRKSLLTLSMTLSIIPGAILAYSRNTKFFYAYYAFKTLVGIVGEGTGTCLILAYVADNTSDVKRGSAFGVLGGVSSTAFVCGTVASRFLPMDLSFKVSAALSMVSTVYMRIFLEESMPSNDLRQPILKGEASAEQNDDPLAQTTTQDEFKKLPSMGSLINLLKTRPTFCKAAVVSFFNGLSDGGMHASVLYFLKARFHFNKNQFADIMLIGGLANTVSLLLVMPLLVPRLREEKLLSLGLLIGSISIFVYSISWAEWVPYAIVVFSLITTMARPALNSIASKQVGPHEQGLLQGCLSGINSLANIIAPLIFSPLTALFLSDRAPFPFPGFSIMCLGIALMSAFIQSLFIEGVPSTINSKTCCNTDAEV